MQWFRLRPTFELAIGESREQVIKKLAQVSEQFPRPDLFRMHGEYGELHLPPEQHRVWSPHLSFYVTNHNSNQSILGRFAPRVDVWTSVWIFYLLMAFTAFFGVTLAYSQWMLGQSAWGLWIGIAPIVAIFILYIVAHLGQQWSVDQMHQLRAELESILSEAGIELPEESSNH